MPPSNWIAPVVALALLATAPAASAQYSRPPGPTVGGGGTGNCAYTQCGYISHNTFASRGKPPEKVDLDPDKDGKVTLDELVNFYWSRCRLTQADVDQSSWAGDKADWPAFAARFDGNHNGRIDKGELKAGLKVEFAADDLNKDGVLTWDEQDGPVRGPFFAWGQMLLDTDNDGVVSLDEMRAYYWREAIERDRNGDGQITKAEWQAGPAHALAGAALPGDDPIFQLLDQDHNGVVTRDEVDHQIGQVFALLDTDHDGKLSDKEQAANRLSKRATNVLFLGFMPERGAMASQVAAANVK